MSHARNIIKASCLTALPLTPIGRLDAVYQRLVGVIKAVQIVRSPLEKFYDLLSDDLRRQFNTMAVAAEERGQPSSTSLASNPIALCRQQSEGVPDLAVQRIEQAVQPSAQQRSAFETLKKAAENAASSLQSSCPAAPFPGRRWHVSMW